MNKIIVIVVVSLLLVGGGVFWIMNSSDSNDTEDVGIDQQEDQTETSEDDEPEGDGPEAVITYTDSGFSSDNVTVSAGSVIEIRNTSSSTLDLASDPHPAHTHNVELNVGLVPSGESRQFTATVVGDWGFHNHIRPEHTGRITISD